ncbi:unnamed protein product [marine sediment metagenome]|uniref:Uncharacterized protein n=1 Tax=marine sediment metagenome TaxID=412755 RepID=X1IFS2_9ZZZZ
MPATRKTIAESLNRIANNVKDTAVRTQSIRTAKGKSLVNYRLRNSANELLELADSISYLSV